MESSGVRKYGVARQSSNSTVSLPSNFTPKAPPYRTVRSPADARMVNDTTADPCHKTCSPAHALLRRQSCSPARSGRRRRRLQISYDPDEVLD
jgi:hypothetical protein